MTTAVKNFVGLDISKHTIDAALIINLQKEKIIHAQFPKDKSGLIQFTKWLKSHKINLGNETLCCMEHTGLYNREGF
jgi:hypothetical protein